VESRNPEQFMFIPDQNVGREQSLQLEVWSEEGDAEAEQTAGLCMFVAVNLPGCPWHQSSTTIRNSKLWFRMLRKGILSLEVDDFPDGFSLTLLTLSDSSECYSSKSLRRWMAADEQLSGLMEKKVMIRVSPVFVDYSRPVWISVASLLAIAILPILLGSAYKLSGRNWFKLFDLNADEEGEEEMTETTPVKSSIQTENGENHEEELTDSQQDLKDTLSVLPKLVKSLEWAFKTYVENAENSELNELEGTGEFEKYEEVKSAIERLKVMEKQGSLKVSDLTKHIVDHVWYRRSRSKVYLLLVPLLGLYYLVPSVQLVVHQLLLQQYSEQCYFNFGCARAWWIFPDFNHAVSNAGYIILGLTFFLITYLKAWYLLPEDHNPSVDHRSDKGLLQQYSIFYTLAVCMVLQGVFSIIFHICPSNLSLQFDTTMMYIMLLLVFTKIYQFRHPDTTVDAFTCMWMFWLLLGMEAVSVYITGRGAKLVFYAIFSFMVLTAILQFNLDSYFYGAIRTSHRATIPVLVKNCGLLCNGSERFHIRFYTKVALLGINLSMLVFFMFKVIFLDEADASSLSTPILLLCSGNVALYIVEYLFSKCFEITRRTQYRKLRLILLFGFLGLFLLVAAGAGYFYAMKAQDRNLTPAESRDKNLPCRFGNFFDNHDMWHFLSSIALFLSLMFLLNIDDDLFYELRAEIKVF